MKKALTFKINLVLKAFILFGGLLSLVSFAPPKKTFSKTLSDAELSALTEKVMQDSISLAIIQKDAERMAYRVIKIANFTQEKWQKLADKKQWNAKETDSIYSFFGFAKYADLLEYVKLQKLLDEKYGMNPDDHKNYPRFKELLQKKQQDYIDKNELFKAAYSKQLKVTGGMPPECWKCAYDYRDCLNQTGIYAIKYQSTTMYNTTVYITTSNVSVVTTSFDVLSHPTITYISPTVSVSGCTPIYRSCIGSCMN